MTAPLRIVVDPESSGSRLDRLLAARLDRSRSQIQKDLAEERILVDGRPARASTRVDGGEVITVAEPAARSAKELEAEPLPLEVLWADDDLVVLDKPAGLAVHPGAGRDSGTLSHRLVARFPELADVGHPQRPGVVHRLDLGTSGVMIVARNERAYRLLSDAFARRRVAKEYLAIVHGALPDALTLDDPIGRHPTRRQQMTIREGGRQARTDVVSLDRAARDRLSLALVRLHTGRTHQIRVHLKHAGHPLVGDPVYGEARWKELQGAARTAARSFGRPALHAWRLTLRHPVTRAVCSWTAPPPEDLERLWETVGGRPLETLLSERPAPPLDASKDDEALRP